MVSDNPFEILANQQLVQAAKRRHKDAEKRAAKSVVLSDKDAPMIGNAMEKARDKRDAQVANYGRQKANELDELLHGPYEREMRGLVAFLKGMTADSADALVSIANAQWIRDADLHTKHAVLSLIADAILKLRVRNGLAPFNDAIGDEAPTAFQIVRKGMMGV